jgi:uncharacterized protein
MFFLVPIGLLLAVLYAWAIASFPWLARRRRAVAVVLSALWLAQIVSHWLVGHDLTSTAPRMIVELIVMPLVISAFPIGALRLALWALERRRKPAEVDASEGMSRRQLIEGAAGVALIGGTGSMLGWGMARGRHAFEMSEVPVRIAGLPRVLDGYVIAQISDIHGGLYVGERELDEGLEYVRKARPDLIVATGDLVDFDADWAPMIGRKLVDLGPRDGVVAVPGNHDYYADVDDVADALREAGVKMLVDDGLVIRPGDGGGFSLLGVDDRWSTRYGRAGPRLARALSMVPPDLARILLSHQPPTVDLWAGQVALQLSGHTHGGQINPGFRPADLFLKYVSGLYQVRGTTLYVNRGFGTVGTPSRVGAPPEVTRFVLVAA